MLTAKETLAEQHTVYNLEVYRVHNYLVSEVGVLVHNNSDITSTVIQALRDLKSASYRTRKHSADHFYIGSIRPRHRSNSETFRQTENYNNMMDEIIRKIESGDVTPNTSSRGFYEYDIDLGRQLNDVPSTSPYATQKVRVRISPTELGGTSIHPLIPR